MPGTAGNDTPWGPGGDDTLEGGAGDDSHLGGEGTDTARFDAASTEVLVTVLPAGGGSRIKPANGGEDTVVPNVALFEFTDAALTQTQVQEIADLTGNRIHVIELNGRQVTTPTGSEGFGAGFMRAQPSSNTVDWAITVEGLDFGSRVPGSDARQTEDTSHDVTVAHIHVGAPGANGAAAFDLLADADLQAKSNEDGSWTLRGIWEEDEGFTPCLPALATTEPGTPLA